MADDPAVEMRRVVVLTNGTPVAIVEKKCSRRRLLGATPMAHRFIGGPDRDRRQGGPDATTTDGPRDGSDRVGEIALMTDRDATIEFNPSEATTDIPGSHIAATTPKKLRCINKSSGASRSPDATRRRTPF